MSAPRPAVTAVIPVATALAFASLAAALPGARAQGGPVPPGPPVRTGAAPAAPQPPPLNSLRNGLDAVYWDTTQRGPLLALAPDTVRPVWQSRPPRPGPNGMVAMRPVPPPAPQQNGTYRVTDLAEYFGRRVVRLKGLSVLAPTEMVVLNTRPGKPDYFANLSQQQKMTMLQASLSPAQWKALAGEAGLGAGDLAGDQRDLFLSIVPDPVVIHKMKIVGPYSRSTVDGFQSVTLSPAQRGAIRLRMYRTVQFSVPYKGAENTSYNMGTQPIGSEYAYVQNASSYNPLETQFGVALRALVPSRLKPQQIDFAAPALGGAVSLTGVRTVGELVERIRTQTRTALFVDGRAAKQALWIRAGQTQTISAGEALQALCWSLSGAVRYVPEGEGKGVFILTQDLEGIGSRLARMGGWAQAAQQHTTVAQMALQEKIRKQSPLQYITFSPDDPAALDPKLNKSVEDSWKTFMPRYRGTPVSMGDLSPRQQEIVRQGIASYDRTSTTVNGEQRDLVTDGPINVMVNVRSVFLAPGFGEVHLSSFDGGSGVIQQMLPPPTAADLNAAAPPPPKLADSASIPATLPLGGIVCVAPTTNEEAVKAVRAARASGLKQVWVVVSLAPGAAEADSAAVAKAKALLAAAAAEAGAQKPALQVLAGVRLFSLGAPPETTAAPSGRPEVGERDLTITGELPREFATRLIAEYQATETDPALARYQLRNARDWVRPTVPALAARLARNLAAVAATPGLSGMALLDTAPPGYGATPRNTMFAGTAARPELGYTAAARAGFIRTAGYDPIDLEPSLNFGNVDRRLPFFTADNQFGGNPFDTAAINATPSGQWYKFRTELISQTLKELHGPLMKALPQLPGGFPVYLQNLDAGGPFGGDWFSLWEKPDGLPSRPEPAPGASPFPLPNAPAPAGIALFALPHRDPAPSPYPSVMATSQAPPPAPAVQFARGVNGVLNQSGKAGWKGLVLDFSDVSVDRAIEALANIVPAATKAAPK